MHLTSELALRSYTLEAAVVNRWSEGATRQLVDDVLKVVDDSLESE
jgi:hypothetical protein